MAYKDYSKVIKDLLDGKLKESSKEYKALKELVFSLSRKYLQNPSPMDLEDVWSEFLYRLSIYKNRFLSPKPVSAKYIEKMVKNIIIDLNSSKEKVFSEYTFETKEGKVFTIEDFVGVEDKNILNAEVEQSLERLKALLREEDYEVLCYYVLKMLHDIQIKVSISKDNLYKRWERLKKRIEPIFRDLNDYQESYLIKKLSELCKNRGY